MLLKKKKILNSIEKNSKIIRKFWNESCGFMRFTRRLAGILALVLCVSVFVQIAAISTFAANSGFSLSVGPIENGGLVKVTVTVDGGYDMAGCKLKLRYDEAFLQYVSADFGSFSGLTEAGVSDDGNVTLSFVSMDGISVTQTFCTVVFRIVDGAVGTTTIQPIVAEAIDSKDQTIGGLAADAVSLTVTAQSLSITSNPTKKYYFCGESLDTSGMTVEAVFPNGATKTVTDFGVFNFETTSSGWQTVTVRSGKLTDTFDVLLVRKGDVNGDDLVNLADYAMIVDTAVYAKVQPEGESLFRQDLLADGAVDCFDAAYEDLLICGIVQ